VKDSASTPTLRERIPARVSESREGEDSPFILLNARPEVTASWVRYLEDRWKPWAEKDRALPPGPEGLQLPFLDLPEAEEAR
jgi:hypothetical protein